MNPEPLARRAFARLAGEDGYHLTWMEKSIRLELRHVRRHSHELWGELTALCDWPGAHTHDGSLSTADFNLSSDNARKSRAVTLAERSETKPGEFDWRGLLEEFCVSVIKAERNGSAATILADAPFPAPDSVLELGGLPVLLRHPMILFGDGGSAKSYLALWVAAELALRGKAVLYVDWELTAEDHHDRLKRLTGFPEPRNIHYYRGNRPLHVEADGIDRAIRDHRIDYTVYDSVAFAAGGAPESAEIALAYFGAIRRFGVGSLHIAHISKSEHGDQRPFGSAFWHNSARSTWYLERANDLADEDLVQVAAYHRKANTSRKRPAIGFELRFTEDRTEVQRFDPGRSGSQQLSEKLPVWQRIRAAVSGGSIDLPSLAEDIHASEETISRTVRRMGMFRRVTGSDGVVRIGLAESRHVP